MVRVKKDSLIQYNRTSILQIAKKLFMEKGYAQTTMDDIAKTADYSKSTLYVYFKSKEEIMNYLIYDGMKMLKDFVENSMEQPMPIEEKFFYICNAMAEFQEKEPLLFHSVLGEISVSQEDMEKYPILLDTYNVGEEINQLFVTLIAKGQEEGIFRKDLEPIPTVFSLWASISGIINISGAKTKYLKMETGKSKQDFLQYGFNMIYQSIKL